MILPYLMHEKVEMMVKLFNTSGRKLGRESGSYNES